MHRTYTISVKDLLKKEDNLLTVLFSSPVIYANKMQDKSYLPAFTVPERGFTHIRKASCMFGWDWGPNLPDMGIWKDVVLCGYSGGKIDDVLIKQTHKDSCVYLDILTKVEDFKTKTLSLKAKVFNPDGELIKTACIDNIAGQTNKFEIKIDNPSLWWTNGLGAHPLYTVEVSLFEDGKECDTNKKRIGLRTFKVIQTDDEYGRSFTYELNGKKIFAMGADYIPEDNILGRVSEKTTKHLIDSCVSANFNTLRVWGGANFPFDWFYDLCDENGILIWQDMMFACGTYELTEEFEATVREEVYDNVKRLRHHPCIAMWCGNNELEMFWSEDRYGKDVNPKLKQDYYKLFEDIFPKIFEEIDGERLYWPSSPSSGGMEANANGENYGDMHYWGVWHEKEEFTAYRRYFPRFMSEFGIQSYPSMKTVNTFTEEEDREMYSPVMQNHQKNPAGNGLITYYIRQNYSEPKDFKDAVYLSQMIQAEGLRYGVEHLRRNRGRCMGAIFWQLNDCWQTPSWSSIDYFGRWKALHYFAKRFFAPVLLSAEENGTTVKIVVTNDTLTDFEGFVKCSLKTNKGEILREENFSVNVKKLDAKQITIFDFADIIKTETDKSKCYFEYSLYNGEDLISTNDVLFVKAKDFDFEKPNINVTLEEDGNDLFISLSSDTFVKAVELDLKTDDCLFTDNYFDLSPCVTKRVRIEKMLSKRLSKKDLEEQLVINYLQK